MIRELFEKRKPCFISIRGNDLILKNIAFPHLDILIADLLPIRKLFIDKKLSCYALDNTRGKHGQYCALCRQRFRCQQKLRLMILVHNIEQKPIPAIFEIDQRSFDSLEEVIQKIEKEKLFDTLMVIQVIHNEKNRTAIEFSPKY